MNTINYTNDIYTLQNCTCDKTHVQPRILNQPTREKQKQTVDPCPGDARCRETSKWLRSSRGYIIYYQQTWIKIHITNKAGEESGTTCVWLCVCNQVNSYPEPVIRGKVHVVVHVWRGNCTTVSSFVTQISYDGRYVPTRAFVVVRHRFFNTTETALCYFIFTLFHRRSPCNSKNI